MGRWGDGEMGRWGDEGESNSFKTYRTLYELLAFFFNETLRVGVGVGEASRREASRREASRRDGVLAVAYGKPQSVYDKLSFSTIFA
ncbi:MAG: hypothetical protein RMY29_006695 [Nostoc sp. CreGUA01]|nr:hypothetical protein [Nostoc sp. CreGUA01]